MHNVLIHPFEYLHRCQNILFNAKEWGAQTVQLHRKDHLLVCQSLQARYVFSVIEETDGSLDVELPGTTVIKY
jgi:hypothetical protein